MPRVLASLRSANLSVLDQELERLENAGVDGLHIDVMDGRFVAEECFPPSFVADLKTRTPLMIDVHLLATDPAAMAAEYVAAGAHRVSFHVETVEAPADLAEEIRRAGAEPGLVLLPSTPVESVFDLLESVALVNPLGVDPTRGLGFQESTYARIEALVAERERRGLPLRVQADGGVWAKTRDGLVAAGADELVGGYPIFSHDDYAVAVRELRDGAGAAG